MWTLDPGNGVSGKRPIRVVALLYESEGAQRMSISWVSNPQPARLYYVDCGHICKLCVCYKNYRRLGILLVVIFPRVTREPAHNTVCFGCHKNVGHQYSTWSMRLAEFSCSCDISG
jgi:hypothetical protein